MKMTTSLTQYQIKTLLVTFVCLSIARYEATVSSLCWQFNFVTPEEIFEMISQVLQIMKGIIFLSLFFMSNTI